MQFKGNFIAKLVLTAFFATVTFPLSAQWDKDVFSWRGRRALQEGKYATAIENFNILASLDTTDYWTFFFRGIAKYNLGDLRGAQNDFNTSVRLNPVFTNGYHYRAITKSRFGKYDEAFADYDRAISLRPGAEGLYYSRGVTYFLSQQFENAVSDFNRYIRKQPKDPSAYLNRGASFLYLKDTVAALEDYNKAIKLDRFDPEGYVRRGRLFASQGRMAEGIADLDKAIELSDGGNSFAHFNRALMYFDSHRYAEALSDLDKVLAEDPGNALTLYNRGLIKAQLGDMEGALADLDRVLDINPDNVLVYFNRASVFIQMGMYQDALEDYDRAIALYPDFAKAYMNRAYVKNLLGRHKSSKADYDTARRKVSEYRAKNLSDEGSFADTTRKYSSLIALDAEFAKKDFNDELLQHRDVDVKLRPMYKFVPAASGEGKVEALSRRYEHPIVDRFVATSATPVKVASGRDEAPGGSGASAISPLDVNDARSAFIHALYDCEGKQFNTALANYDLAVSSASDKGVDALYQAFYLMNRGVLRAEMIDFINSMGSNVQVLTMDDALTSRARVKDHVSTDYDYSQAIADLVKAAQIAPDVAYILYDLGNLYCLSSDHISSIKAYTKAIEAYPYMGDAYFNRALVQIYLKDKEKGCNDLSVAGELGVKEAYGIIKKYCEQDEVH